MDAYTWGQTEPKYCLGDKSKRTNWAEERILNRFKLKHILDIVQEFHQAYGMHFNPMFQMKESITDSQQTHHNTIKAVSNC